MSYQNVIQSDRYQRQRQPAHMEGAENFCPIARNARSGRPWQVSNRLIRSRYVEFGGDLICTGMDDTIARNQRDHA